MTENEAAAEWDRLSPEQLVRIERRQWGCGGELAAFPSAELDGGDLPRVAILTSAQQVALRRDLLFPGNPAANRVLAIYVRGALDLVALERSLQEIVRRHDVLRTTVTFEADQVVQTVHPHLVVSFPVTELRASSRREQEAEARVRALAAARRRFDPETGPFLRAHLWRLSDRDHGLLLAMPEFAADAWSVGLIFHELTTLYAAFVAGQPSPLVEPPLQFADVVAWHERRLDGRDGEMLRGFWRRQFADAPPTLAVPVARPRPSVATNRGARQPLTLTAPLTAAIRELSRRERTPTFATLLAAFATLLGCMAQQEDLLIDTPVSGRAWPNTEGVVGPLGAALPLRFDLSGDPTFRELVERTRQTSKRSYKHQAVSLDRLMVDWPPDTSTEPFAEPRFAVRYQHPPRTRRHLPDVSFNPIELDVGTATRDLTWDVFDSKGTLDGWLEYSTDAFDAETVGQIARQLRLLLERVVDQPDERLSVLTTEAVLQPRAAGRVVVSLRPTDGVAESDRTTGARDEPTEPLPTVSLVPLQPKGSEPPLFMVPGFLGAQSDLLRLAKLAKFIGPDQPFYGFHFQGADGFGDPYRWLEALISGALNEMRGRQPEGPYRLGGICGGGLFAYEVAQNLLAQGEDVAGLYMFDSWHASGYNLAGFRAESHTLPAYRAALLRWQPLPYPNRLTLVVNEEWHRKNPTLGWNDLAQGGLETHVLAGNHHILKPDRVAATAEVLRACLNATSCDDRKP